MYWGLAKSAVIHTLLSSTNDSCGTGSFLPQEAGLLLVSNKNLDSGRYFIYDIDNAPLAFQMSAVSEKENGSNPLRAMLQLS